MNELLPIVRRVRRPLVVEIKPAVVGVNVEPAKAVAEVVTTPKPVTPADAVEETVAE